MDSDDRAVGAILSRREAVQLLGAGGFAALCSPVWLFGQAGSATSPGCVVRPELIEGPYYLDKQAIRTDIRSGKSGPPRPGVPLTIAFAISHVSGGNCSPLPRATVELWQCDALGVYSGVSDARYGFQTQGETFLRGSQMTDVNGAARFTTIYPGWYGGRAVHVHFKIRAQSTRSSAYEFTSQLFFPEELTDEVHAQSPYSEKGRRDMTNERDGIFRRGGDNLVLRPTKSGAGYGAQFGLALDLSDEAVGRPDGEGMRRGGPGRRGRSSSDPRS
jgi:protocatechuate 3,4-dioxygenase beta subunit